MRSVISQLFGKAMKILILWKHTITCNDSIRLTCEFSNYCFAHYTNHPPPAGGTLFTKEGEVFAVVPSFNSTAYDFSD